MTSCYSQHPAHQCNYFPMWKEVHCKINLWEIADEIKLEGWLKIILELSTIYQNELSSHFTQRSVCSSGVNDSRVITNCLILNWRCVIKLCLWHNFFGRDRERVISQTQSHQKAPKLSSWFYVSRR